MMQPGVEPEYLLIWDTHKHTILMLCLFRTRRWHISYFYIIALISHRHGGQVDGRFYTRIGWDFIFSAILLELENGHEIQIKYIVVKYAKGTSQDPF